MGLTCTTEGSRSLIPTARLILRALPYSVTTLDYAILHLKHHVRSPGYHTGYYRASKAYQGCGHLRQRTFLARIVSSDCELLKANVVKWLPESDFIRSVVEIWNESAQWRMEDPPGYTGVHWAAAFDLHDVLRFKGMSPLAYAASQVHMDNGMPVAFFWILLG